jgi:hypothetical protein
MAKFPGGGIQKAEHTNFGNSVLVHSTHATDLMATTANYPWRFICI